MSIFFNYNLDKFKLQCELDAIMADIGSCRRCGEITKYGITLCKECKKIPFSEIIIKKEKRKNF